MIFGIGLPKSGTRSLHQALRLLGYKGSHHNHDWRHELMALHPKHTRDPNRYIVLPAPHPAQALMEALPDAKFILTIRELEAWLTSATEHWRPRVRPQDRHKPKAILRDLDWAEFLHTLDPTREQLEDIYHEWHLHVDSIFEEDQERLLKLNICGGEGWKKLCPFLGKPIPAKPFPYVGKFKEK